MEKESNKLINKGGKSIFYSMLITQPIGEINL
jgi:hypothetical protein